PGPGPAVSSPVHRGELLRGAPAGGTGALSPPSNPRGAARGPPATLPRRHGGGDDPRSTDVGSFGPGGRQGVCTDRGPGRRGRRDGGATDQDGRHPCLRVGNRGRVAPWVRGPRACGGDWSRARLFGSLRPHGVPERAHLRPSPSLRGLTGPRADRGSGRAWALGHPFPELWRARRGGTGRKSRRHPARGRGTRPLVAPRPGGTLHA